MTIGNLLYRQENNTKIALKYGKGSISYEEWAYESKKLKSIICKLLPNESKCIAIYLPNSIQYAIAYFGILFSERVIIPIDPQSKAFEICSIVKYCEVDMIISSNAYKHIFEKVSQICSNRVIVYYIDTQEKIEYGKADFVQKTDNLMFSHVLSDVAIMLHTSGTTSDPKRVMLTHRNIISNIESNIKSLGLKEDDISLIALPMYFGYCNTAQFLTHVYLGGTIVILNTIFLPKQFWGVVEKENITNFTAVPSMLLMLVDYQYYKKYNYSSLKYICFGGGAMALEKLKILIKRFPTISFIHTYGQTECSPRITALLSEDSLRKIGSVGKAIPGVRVNIVDQNDNQLGAGERGEIVVEGDNIMKGYYKKPKFTSDILRNNLLHTGDIGYFDEDGYLYITGRKKNVIISGGVNIYPEEIEMIILSYEGVKNALVLGESHNLLGEVPIAKVIVDDSVNIDELRKYCLKHLAGYKIPVRFDKVIKLKKTYNGKNKRD